MGTKIVRIKIGGGVMKYAYKFEHKRIIEVSKENGEKIYNTKLLGFFQSEEKCKELIPEYLKQPGFRDHPDDFVIEEVEADVNDFNDVPGEFKSSVFHLTHEWYDGEFDYVTDLGSYSAEELARKAKIEYQLDPDYIDHPDGFCISKYIIGEHEWAEGFCID